MKFVIVFVALLAVAFAAPQPGGDAVILSQNSDVHPEGFKYDVETSDGTSHHSEGTLKNVGTDHESQVVHGSYSWKADDGQVFTVTYVADENGFQPTGAHLPVA